MIKAKKILAGVLSAVMMLTSAGVTTAATTVGVFAAESYDYTINATIPDLYWTGDEEGINAQLADYFYEINPVLATDNTMLYYGYDFTAATTTSNQGPAQAIITGAGDYATKTFAPMDFTIVAPPEKPVYGAVWAEGFEDFYYDGDILDADEVAEVVEVYQYDGEEPIKRLTRGTSEGQYVITVTPKEDGYVGNAGEAYNVRIEVNGYEGAIAEVDFIILQKPLAELIITGTPAAEYVYDATEKNVEFTKISYQFEEGGASYDFTDDDISPAFRFTGLGWENDDWTNAGEQTATIEAEEEGNFTGLAKVKFAITPAQIVKTNLLLVNTPLMNLPYTGFPINPSAEDLGVEFYFGDNVASGLVPAEDYVLVYDENSTDIGSYNISVAPSETGNLVFAAGGASDSRSAYKIIQNSLENELLVAVWACEDYGQYAVPAGTDVAADFSHYYTVMLGDGFGEPYILEAGKDFTVAYAEGGDHHDEEGRASVIVLTGIGNFKDTKEVTFTTEGVLWADSYDSAYEVTYNGTAWKPLENTLGDLTAELEDGTAIILTPADYEVVSTGPATWGDNTNASTETVKAYATISGKGAYAGKTARAYFTIKPVDVTGFTAEVTGLPEGINYMTGRNLSALTPAPVVTVKNGTETVADFTGTVYADSIVDGYLKTVVIEASGNYTGTITADVNVSSLYTPFNTTNFTITTRTIYAGLKAYDEATLKNYVTITTRLRNPNFDLAPEAYSITDIKCATEGKTLGEPGSVISFTLVPADDTGIRGTMDGTVAVIARPITDLEEAVSLSETEYVYDGTEKKPVVTIAATEYTNELVEGVDFTVEVQELIGGKPLVDGKAVNAGAYGLVIKGKGNYTEEPFIVKEFTIKKAVLTAADLTVIPPEAYDRQFYICEDANGEYYTPELKAPGKMVFEEDEDYEIFIKPGQSVKATDVATEKEILSTVLIDSANYERATFDVAYTLLPRTLSSDDLEWWGNLEINIEKPGFIYNEAYATAAGYDPALLGEVMVAYWFDDPATTLVKGTDYTLTITGTNKVGADDVKAVFTFAGNYKGTVTMPLQIVEAVDFSNLKIIVPPAADRVYNGRPIPVTINNIGTEPIVEGIHYNVLYYDYKEILYVQNQIESVENAIKNAASEEEAEALRAELAELEAILKDLTENGMTSAPVNAGFYLVEIKATPVYGGKVQAMTFYQITPIQVSQEQFDEYCADLTLVYNPKNASEYNVWGPFIAEGTYKDLLQLAYDEEEDYAFDLVTGKATVVLREDGNYSGVVSKEITFKVATEVTIKDYTISPQVYTGQAIEPAVELAAGSKASLDWVTVINYQGNVDVSKKTAVAFVVIDVPETETEFYSYTEGTQRIVFQITPAAISDQKITVASATYNGKAQKPAVTVKNAFGEILKEGEDYRIDGYKNNVNAGKGTVTVTGIKNYDGTEDVTFTIKKAKNTMTVKAKTVKGNSQKKTVIKASKAFTVKNAVGKVTYKKTSGNAKIKVSKGGKVTINKGLKKGKTYTVKVKVTAAGNKNYKKLTKTVKLKVKITK